MKNVKPALVIAITVIALGMFFFVYLILPKNNGAPKSTPQSTSSSNQNLNPQLAAVSIKNFAYKPATLHINRGSTVTWTNGDDAVHTVVDDGGGFSSADLSREGTFSYTFANSGTYTYHCSKHPSEKGTIVVN